MCDAIVLLAHGARDPEWARPVEAIAARLRALLPDVPVKPAFLEFMSPDLDTAITALVAGGARKLSVVPVFLAQGGHVKRDLPQKLDGLRARLQSLHADLCIDLESAIGEKEEVINVIAGSVARDIMEGRNR